MSNEEKKGKAFLSFIPKLVVSAIYSFLVVYFFEWKYAIFTARPLLEGHFGLAVLAFFSGIIGAFAILMIVSAWHKRVTVFTRNPITYLFKMYVGYPCIGVVVGQIAILLVAGLVM